MGRSACIEGDLVQHHFTIKGLVGPYQLPAEESQRQLALRWNNCVEPGLAGLAGELAVPVGFFHNENPGFDDVVASTAQVDEFGDDAQAVTPADRDERAVGVVAGHPEAPTQADERLVQVHDADA